MNLYIFDDYLFEVTVIKRGEGFILRVKYKYEDPLGEMEYQILTTLEPYGFVLSGDERFTYYCSNLSAWRVSDPLTALFEVEKEWKEGIRKAKLAELLTPGD